ncbi:SGNH/GDSL hydrolase family protein [Micromonospora narathiwatensis]|uniref:GDSL-like Lipase/Acylhydrolase family protein n=1 Tax=Micromonospora narathiwatensis TaxID=299146 RepID=A0A1A8ZX06_9ACTN|nr:SGNH/GDSL hydrolase family protein [Micromonospora narathiwatensis]SBT48420.1 GDSL-like Lipase/Acylhydrolase family protein [Micromonospora narathiwatensis]
MRRSRLATFALTLASSLGVTLAMAVPAQAAATDRYVALGDSYASGVGADSYTSESGSCMRSNNAYPALYNTNIKPASYRSVACSGATTTDVINNQLSALSSTTTLVSVTIGGNDVGFSSIMTTCVLNSEAQCIAAIDAAENKARSELPGKLANVYNGIKSRSPSARVVVVGYPVFYQLGNPICVGLTEKSRAKINEGINLVDDIIRTAATSAGFKFADVRSSFVGHQLCSGGEKWLHALNFLNLTISYHPTAAGQSGGYYPVFRSTAG